MISNCELIDFQAVGHLMESKTNGKSLFIIQSFIRASFRGPLFFIIFKFSINKSSCYLSRLVGGRRGDHYNTHINHTQRPWVQRFFFFFCFAFYYPQGKFFLLLDCVDDKHCPPQYDKTNQIDASSLLLLPGTYLFIDLRSLFYATLIYTLWVSFLRMVKRPCSWSVWYRTKEVNVFGCRSKLFFCIFTNFCCCCFTLAGSCLLSWLSVAVAVEIMIKRKNQYWMIKPTMVLHFFCVVMTTSESVSFQCWA